MQILLQLVRKPMQPALHGRSALRGWIRWVLPVSPRLGIAAFAAFLLLSFSAFGGERITLRNGFAIPCDHHAVIEGRTRLFTHASEDSYIEFPTEQIVSFENVPDPPAPPVAVSDAAPKEVPDTDKKLSPADLHEMLAKAGAEHNLDVDLLASLIKAESGGNTHATSCTGARGLMQLMPGTAKNLGVEDSYKPEQNVRGGSLYLDSLLTLYHDNLAKALAAYNAGPAAVEKYHGIPPYRETQAYVARVIHEFNRRVLAREALARQATSSSLVAQNRATH